MAAQRVIPWLCVKLELQVFHLATEHDGTSDACAMNGRVYSARASAPTPRRASCLSLITRLQGAPSRIAGRWSPHDPSPARAPGCEPPLRAIAGSSRSPRHQKIPIPHAGDHARMAEEIGCTSPAPRATAGRTHPRHAHAGKSRLHIRGHADLAGCRAGAAMCD